MGVGVGYLLILSRGHADKEATRDKGNKFVRKASEAQTMRASIASFVSIAGAAFSVVDNLNSAP